MTERQEGSRSSSHPKVLLHTTHSELRCQGILRLTASSDSVSDVPLGYILQLKVSTLMTQLSTQWPHKAEV